MIFEKRTMVKAPLEKVWEFVWDMKKLTSCIEGCNRVEEVDPKKKYNAFVDTKVGPFKASFAVELEVLEVIEGALIKAKSAGKDSKLAASMKQQIELRLKEVSKEETELSFKTDVGILGKLATLGHWMIKKKADEVMDNFVAKMKGQLENA
jgi:carbon monoxide dehydrogenase subunit G